MAAVSVGFASRGNCRDVMDRGWSQPEPWGTWTVGQESALIFRLSRSVSHVSLSLSLTPYLAGGHLKSQHLEILVNAVPALSEAVAAQCDLRAELHVPDNDTIEIVLRHPDAIAPDALGLSSDPRQIAFLVSNATLAFAPADAEIVPSPLAGHEKTRRHLIRLSRFGNLGNRMIRYMAAMKIAAMLPGCELCNVRLPEWGLSTPDKTNDGDLMHIADEQHIPFGEIASKAAAGDARLEVEYSGFGQRMENFLDRAVYRDVFRPAAAAFRRFDDAELLINVRSAEIVTALHWAYPLIPPQFYRDVIERSGRRPVFMGQTTGNAYTDALRRAFPDAAFVPSQGAVEDFESIRSARHIVTAVSTFSWLAAWLSDAEDIHMPVNGLLNPMHEPRVDLLPLDDPRYRFYLFPYNTAVAEPLIADMHRAISGWWRLVSPGMLRDMRAARPRFARRIEDFDALFDEAFYLGRHSDIAKAISVGGFADAREHYRKIGFYRRLECFALDRAWYIMAYPMAAFEIGQGDVLDPEHHYAAVGRARGYRPHP